MRHKYNIDILPPIVIILAIILATFGYIDWYVAGLFILCNIHLWLKWG